MIDKATKALNEADVAHLAVGVFNLDGLEEALQGELSQRVAIGVAYAKAAPVEIDFNRQQGISPSRAGGGRTYGFEFLVMLATPVSSGSCGRHSGTKLLTVLRNAIQGTPVSTDDIQRTWALTTEGPRPDASSDTLLYYAQVWQINLPILSQLSKQSF